MHPIIRMGLAVFPTIILAACGGGGGGGSSDFGTLQTLRFYEVYRACVRAKVAAIRLRQGPVDPATLERELATYLSTAELAARPSQPMLVATTGLSGSGKSWLASRLLAPLGAVRVRSDVERKRLAALPVGEAGSGSLYTEAMTRLTYARLAKLAGMALKGGYSVIVDAACLLADERAAFRSVAANAGVPFRLPWVTADPPLLRSRIDDRAAAGDDPSDATVAVLKRQQSFAQPPSGTELAQTVHIDTTASIDPQTVASILLIPTSQRAAGCGP